MPDKNTVQALFEEHVKYFPNHLAVLQGTQSITYDELNKKANQFAHYLRKLGSALNILIE